jgi:hypothetical protein
MIPFGFNKPRSQKSNLELAIDVFRNALIEVNYTFESASRLAKLYSFFDDFIYLNSYLLAITIAIIRDRDGIISIEKIKNIRLGRYQDIIISRVVSIEKIDFDRVRLDIIRYIIKIWKLRNSVSLEDLLKKKNFKFVTGINY